MFNTLLGVVCSRGRMSSKKGVGCEGQGGGEGRVLFVVRWYIGVFSRPSKTGRGTPGCRQTTVGWVLAVVA